MRRMLKREEGLAMITALLVTMIVLTLSVVMVQLSIHNSDSSAVNRGRVAAVNAAEGGINLVFSQVERNGYANLPCTLDGDLTTTPVEHYHVVVDYYPSYPPSGAQLTCPLGQNPAGAVITSTGTSPGANAAHPVTRIMQAEARLRLVTGNASF